MFLTVQSGDEGMKNAIHCIIDRLLNLIGAIIALIEKISGLLVFSLYIFP